MINLLNRLCEIYQCFGSENILICGALCDTYWINYTDLADIDLLVNESSIKKYFNISSLNYHLNQHGFDIKRRTSTKYKEKFYQGKYFDIKIDLFLVDDFRKLNREIVSVDGSKFGLRSINIDSIKQRVSVLNTHLNYIVTDQTEDWEKSWIKFKKIKAEKKLQIYNLVYPDYEEC
jgi:hypothetical protein